MYCRARKHLEELEKAIDREMDTYKAAWNPNWPPEGQIVKKHFYRRRAKLLLRGSHTGKIGLNDYGRKQVRGTKKHATRRHERHFKTN